MQTQLQINANIQTQIHIKLNHVDSISNIQTQPETQLNWEGV